MPIRDAVEADLPAIVEIYNATIPSRRVTADTQPVTVESRLAWLRDRDYQSRPLWVMEQEQTVVGWLSFQSFYGRPAYQATAEVSVYVAAPYQRRGIGQVLLQQAIQHSPQLGLKNLLGFIFAHNQPSLQLFEKFGFQQWGYLPQVASLDGVERDLVILGRKISRTEPLDQL
ncbi:N-acetyltransferase [Trichocoleus sp. FACHB-591]|uniref:GNAT family N-acetyltransferase n=1 Tax=Trichocoleus sp. FACHB-591 TaxID=2692872 RepID=UPI001687A236|nr:GNAT family N-acetyltransferase [Trichocoleus sp. FACHB-591]MBD2095062.1 N-acetyltransferase [Trichocoleus sp. FACHB-591]